MSKRTIRVPDATFREIIAQHGFVVTGEPLTVIMEDELVHTPDSPWCDDETCPCFLDEFGLEVSQELSDTDLKDLRC